MRSHHRSSASRHRSAARRHSSSARRSSSHHQQHMHKSAAMRHRSAARREMSKARREESSFHHKSHLNNSHLHKSHSYFPKNNISFNGGSNFGKIFLIFPLLFLFVFLFVSGMIIKSFFTPGFISFEEMMWSIITPVLITFFLIVVVAIVLIRTFRTKNQNINPVNQTFDQDNQNFGQENLDDHMMDEEQRICPFCGKNISKNAEFCPECGTQL